MYDTTKKNNNNNKDINNNNNNNKNNKNNDNNNRNQLVRSTWLGYHPMYNTVYNTFAVMVQPR